MLTRNGNIACDFCGKFIAVDELIEQTAAHLLVTPDSEFTKEEYESYHNSCLQKSRRTRHRLMTATDWDALQQQEGEMSEKTVIEVNGVKMEVDMRYARRIEEIRIGDRVKVLKKAGYGDEHKVYPGVVIGFEPFTKLPTIIVAYVDHDWSKAEVKFLHFNTKAEAEIVHAADEDFHVDRDAIIARFDREIATKQREIETIEEQRRYFETNFRAFWTRVEAETAV